MASWDTEVWSEQRNFPVRQSVCLTVSLPGRPLYGGFQSHLLRASCKLHQNCTRGLPRGYQLVEGRPVPSVVRRGRDNADAAAVRPGFFTIVHFQRNQNRQRFQRRDDERRLRALLKDTWPLISGDLEREPPQCLIT